MMTMHILDLTSLYKSLFSYFVFFELPMNYEYKIKCIVKTKSFLVEDEMMFLGIRQRGYGEYLLKTTGFE